MRHVGAVCHVAGLGGLEVVGEEALAGGDGDGERVEAAVLLPAPAPAHTPAPTSGGQPYQKLLFRI